MKIKLNSWKLIMSLIFILSFIQSFSMENPYKNSEVKRVKSSVVKEFGRFQLLENILSGSDGSIYTTSYMEGIIYKIKDGEVSTLLDYDGKLSGIEFLDKDTILACGVDKENKSIVLKIDIATGNSKILARLPDGLLLNGILKLNENSVLIADSFKGVIWNLNPQNGSISLWLDHEKLKSIYAISELKTPNAQKGIPGVNGLKFYNNSIYFTNTIKMFLGKISVKSDGSAGNIEVLKENVFLDDFTLSKNGDIYATTHIFDNVIKISREGEVTIIAQYDQGVAGSTAIIWEHDSDDTLLVSADGGMLKLDMSQVTTAKIIKLKLE